MTKISAETLKDLRQKAIEASKLAYSPYSRIKVGCAIYHKNKEVTLGCNIENASYGATVCAERTAIFQSVLKNAANQMTAIYIYSQDGWPPCGLCRQVMAEFVPSNIEIYLGNKKETTKQYTFQELQPAVFDKKFLK